MSHVLIRRQSVESVLDSLHPTDLWAENKRLQLFVAAKLRDTLRNHPFLSEINKIRSQIQKLKAIPFATILSQCLSPRQSNAWVKISLDTFSTLALVTNAAYKLQEEIRKNLIVACWNLKLHLGARNHHANYLVMLGLVSRLFWVLTEWKLRSRELLKQLLGMAGMPFEAETVTTFASYSTLGFLHGLCAAPSGPERAKLLDEMEKEYPNTIPRYRPEPGMARDVRTGRVRYSNVGKGGNSHATQANKQPELLEGKRDTKPEGSARRKQRRESGSAVASPGSQSGSDKRCLDSGVRIPRAQRKSKTSAAGRQLAIPPDPVHEKLLRERERALESLRAMVASSPGTHKKSGNLASDPFKCRARDHAKPGGKSDPDPSEPKNRRRTRDDGEEKEEGGVKAVRRRSRKRPKKGAKGAAQGEPEGGCGIDNIFAGFA